MLAQLVRMQIQILARHLRRCAEYVRQDSSTETLGLVV
jgi:hypothetical protein